MKVRISFSQVSLEADIYDTPTGREIYSSLPIISSVNTWGDEIYFGIGTRCNPEPDARTGVNLGDLAYWPTMPAFCIFFGPTPASAGNGPRAASAVNVFGKVSGLDIPALRKVRDGEPVTVTGIED